VLNKQYQALLFFSPSAIESFLRENVPAEEVVFCIGSTTAEYAKKHFKEVIEAKVPSVESVLSSLNEYYSK
jgi:uroporphyrinogen-III synthase